jgi:hypothetical protein
MSKNFSVTPLTLKEANEFVDHHHSHNKRVQGYKFAIGAIYDGKLVGVSICGRPISATLDNKKTIELLRSCVLDDAPKNTNSFLYGRSWRVAEAMGYKKMITYTLIREKASACKAIGMKIVGQTKDSTKAWAHKEKKDGIKRLAQEIYKELKYRWEKIPG